MNYFYPGGFNPAGYGGSQVKIDALEQELARLRQMQAQMYGQPNGNMPQSNGRQYEGGKYVYVYDYQEVVNFPTPADGSAVLFLGLDKNGAMDGRGWSKKIINGTSSIQELSVAFKNSYSQSDTQSTQQEQPQPKVTNEDIMALLGNLADRMTALEESKGE